MSKHSSPGSPSHANTGSMKTCKRPTIDPVHLEESPTTTTTIRDDFVLMSTPDKFKDNPPLPGEEETDSIGKRCILLTFHHKIHLNILPARLFVCDYLIKLWHPLRLNFPAMLMHNTSQKADGFRVLRMYESYVDFDWSLSLIHSFWTSLSGQIQRSSHLKVWKANITSVM